MAEQSDSRMQCRASDSGADVTFLTDRDLLIHYEKWNRRHERIVLVRCETTADVLTGTVLVPLWLSVSELRKALLLRLETSRGTDCGIYFPGIDMFRMVQECITSSPLRFMRLSSPACL